MADKQLGPRAVPADSAEIKFLVAADMANRPEGVPPNEYESDRLDVWQRRFNPPVDQSIPEVHLAMLGYARIGYAMPDRSVEPPVIAEMAIQPRYARDPRVVETLLQACGVDAGLLPPGPALPAQPPTSA